MNLSEKIAWQNKGRNACENPAFPKKIKIDICGVCNHSCVFCPNAVQDMRKGSIDDELCRKIISDSYYAGARELGISATGEPLLNKHLEEYIALAKQIGFEYVWINTNGHLLSEDRSASLIESGIDSVKVSLNAAEAETYKLVHGVDCFEIVMENLKTFDKIRRDKSRLYVSFVAIRETMEQAELLRAKLDFIDDFTMSYANSRSGTLETSTLSDSLLGNDEFSFKFPCGQLFNTAVVIAEGYLVICCQDFDKLSVIADLKEIGITEAWNCEKFVSFRRKYLAHDIKNTICFNCLSGKNDAVSPISPKYAHYPINEKKLTDRNKRLNKLAELWHMNVGE